MVTFVCQYCDLTLKKKQVQGHIRGRCAPGAMICIDCSHTFYGMDFKNHLTCISEQEKHWGEFAKNKKTKQIQKQPKHAKPPITTHKKPQKSAQPMPIPTPGQKAVQKAVGKTVEKAVNKQEQIEEQHIQDNAQGWQGWKNEIKQIILQQGQISRQVLLKKLRKIYKQKNGQDIDKQELSSIFDDKVNKIRNISAKIFYSIS